MKKVLFLLAAVLPIITGCDVKELYPGSKVGQTISFSANTAYSNGPSTRTEYSGQFYGDSPKYERINWVVNDTIRIYSDVASEPGTGNNYSDYVVSAVGNNDDMASTATIAPPEGSRGLAWGEGVHNFYGIYPSPTINANVSYTAPDQLSLTIPATQSYTLDGLKLKPDMDYAYMYAVAQTEAQESVSLEFKPLFTAFEFNVDSGNEDSMTLSYFTLTADAESPFLTGNYTATISDTGGYSITVDSQSASRSISLSFGEEGITVTKGSPISFTVFALPHDLSGLTVKFGFTNGKSRELELKKKPEGSEEYQFVTFLGGKKYRITNMNVPSKEVWTYTLALTGATITLPDGTEAKEIVRNGNTAGFTNAGTFVSYKVKDGGPVQIAVDISDTVEYALADENGDPVLNLDGTIAWSTSIPEGISSIAISGTQVDKTLSANLNANTAAITRTESLMIKHARKLQSNGLNGFSQASPQDLSLYDIENLVTPRPSGKPTTANSYIIDRAGWYMFPLVYGNAIDYSRSSAPLYVNGVNQYAYKDTETPSANTDNFWHNFQRFDGGLISSPYILDDLSKTSSDVEAVLLWQDVESETYSFITVSPSIVEVASSSLFYNPISGSYKTSVPYIRFQIPEGSISEDETLEDSKRITGIRQGNAVIALRDKNNIDSSTGQPVILWSWHIWITDGYDVDLDGYGDGLTPINVLTHTGSVKPSNDMMPVNLGWCNVGSVIYGDCVWFVRIRQNEGTEEPVVFKVIQHSATINDNSQGSGTYYQWGRKDPFLPADGFSTSNKACYSPTGYPITINNNRTNFSYDYNPDASAGITHPYISYGEMSGWITLGDYQHGIEEIPANLWNMHNSTYNPDSGRDEDVTVSKTVYDPCPPGYCLPHKTAFSFITITGATVYMDDYEEVNLVDSNGDGSITEDDWVNGWYFKTGNSNGSILYPVIGGRAYGMLQLVDQGHYYTASILGNMYFGDHTDFFPITKTDGKYAEAIRPVKEDAL